MPTLRSLLLDAAAQSPDSVFLRWKEAGEWRTWTYGETAARARVVAEALGALGCRPGDRVAMLMENRPEWVCTYLGIVSCGLTAVPIDAKLRAGEVSHVLRDSEAVAVFGSGRCGPLLREIMGTLRFLRSVVLLDGAAGEDRREGAVRVCDFDRLLAAVGPGAEAPASFFDRHVAREGDVASIIYTSGTTGRSKGAMLTHANFCAQFVALTRFTATRDDNFLLVLPLHHAFAFTANFLLPMACQCQVSMVENLRTIPENMGEVRPTVLVAVPLLAEKILAVADRRLRAGSLSRALCAVGLSRIPGRRALRAFGGRVRLLISGGAPADPAMLRAWRRLGVNAIEGYGLTETAPICTLNPERAVRYGTVGPAIPGHEVRVAEPNEEGVGELEFRGPSVMKGYFRNEDATREAFDGDWFRTGDMGRMDAEGYVTITGRKKSLIVNREGKNIYPEEVELVLNACPHVLESVVLGYRLPGESTGENVGAILVADVDRFARERNRTDVDSASPLSDDQIREICIAEVRDAVRQLAAYKHPRRIRVRFEPLERTQTHKIKRYLYSVD